jgi:hypothetical protein
LVHLALDRQSSFYKKRLPPAAGERTRDLFIFVNFPASLPPEVSTTLNLTLLPPTTAFHSVFSPAPP